MQNPCLICFAVITTTTQTSTSTTAGECMEPLNGLLDLEERRFISPQQNQSTGINANNPWIFELLPYVDAENKPTVTVEFKSKVEVHGFKLQGSGDVVKELQFVVSAKYEVDGLFVELEDEKLIADLTNQRVETVALPSPLSGLLALSLQLESVDQEDAGFGSLRFDVLGCEEEISTTTPVVTTTKVVTTTTQTSTSTTAGYCMDPLSELDNLEQRSFAPQQTLANQSTLINSENPWTFQLSSDAGEEYDNPWVIVQYQSKVEVRGFKLQGNGEDVITLEFILSAKSEDNGQFVDVLEGEKLRATLYQDNLKSITLDSPLPGVVAVKLQVIKKENGGTGSLRIEVLGCEKEISSTTPVTTTTKVVTTTSQSPTSTTAGYCMEQLDGTQGLEAKRSVQPAIANDQSTSVNAQQPWTFSLDNQPSLKDRETVKNPSVTIDFKTEVTVTGVRLQGSTNNDNIEFILLAKRRLGETFVIVQGASGKALVQNMRLNEQASDVTLIKPLKGLIGLRLEVVSLSRMDESQSTDSKLQFSLRAAILGCEEGLSTTTLATTTTEAPLVSGFNPVITTTRLSSRPTTPTTVVTTTTEMPTSTTAGYCMEPMSGEQDLEAERSFTPQQISNQSTNINAEYPWTFELSAVTTPQLTVYFTSKVEVRGFKLQGSGELVKELKFIVLAKFEDNGDFVEVPQDQKITATLSGDGLESVNLDTPLERVVAVRLQVQSIDDLKAGKGSLRLDVLGCKEGRSKSLV
ncbi:uncharacterized protein [Asterias amurensis]|uniref:uncharacterized protein n=1 Tax=Asterias amurensis TaxID=7602 RepID=UPI003AB4C300